MGKVGQTIFGGSKQKSTSGNKAYDDISSSLGGVMGNASGASSALAAMLGIGGDPEAQKAALGNFADSAGMQFLRDEGMQGIVNNKAGAGLLHSGATLKAMDKFNTGLASTYLNDYMSNLLNYGNMGIQAGGVLSDAGKFSKSKGSEKPGLAKTIGAAMAGVPGA